MLFSFGHVFTGGVFVLCGWVCSLPFSGNVQKVRSGTKSVTVKTGRRAGVGSAAKRLEEPNSFFIGGVGFLQYGTSVVAISLFV